MKNFINQAKTGKYWKMCTVFDNKAQFRLAQEYFKIVLIVIMDFIIKG